MKTNDIIKWGAIIIGGLVAIQFLKGKTSGSGPSNTPGSVDLTSNVPSGLSLFNDTEVPIWARTFGPIGEWIYSATAGSGSNGNGGVPGGAPGYPNQIKVSAINPTAAKPKGIRSQGIATVVKNISKGYSTAGPGQAKVIEQLHKDLPVTITKEPGILQPMTIARLQSRAKYGTFGGR